MDLFDRINIYKLPGIIDLHLEESLLIRQGSNLTLFALIISFNHSNYVTSGVTRIGLILSLLRAQAVNLVALLRLQIVLRDTQVEMTLDSL